MKSSLRRPAPLFGLAIAAALTLAACGDDATETTTGAAATDETTATDTGTGTDDASMDSMDSMDEGHDHGDVIEVPEGMAVPTVSLSTTPDSVKGVNLFVDIEDFDIAPENASTDPVDGQGHLHLYVDGERVARFYNTALHLGDLTPGEHEITVEVSANNHSPYAVDGEPITASTTVTVAESEGHSHSHGDDEVIEAASPAPAVELTVNEDPKSGWNLAVEVENFELTPEDEGSDPVDGQGHFHLYVDGVKVGRLYGTDWHLPKLTEGSHEITVEVSANNHLPYAVDGEPITASAMVEVSAEQASGDGHSHGEDDGHSMDDDHGDDDHSMDDDSMSDDAMGDADVMISASYADGSVGVDEDRVEVPLGSTVMIMVTSDVAEEVHLHGYDVYADVTPDEPASMVFDADIPGTFEVELEGSHTLLFEVQVR